MYLVFDEVSDTVKLVYGGITINTKMSRNGFTRLTDRAGGRGYKNMRVGKVLGDEMATSMDHTAIIFSLNVPADVVEHASYMETPTSPQHLLDRSLSASDAKMLDNKVVFPAEVLGVLFFLYHEVQINIRGVTVLGHGLPWLHVSCT
jgi:hypothetical protein